MLIGIIKEKDKAYYVHRKDNNICILYAYKDTVRPLSKLEAINLYNSIFSSKLKFISKEDDYTIYLDENNHKRYFKDGLEDLSKFFIMNGSDGLLYEMSESKKKSIAKILRKIDIAEYILLILVANTFSSHREIKYDPIPFYSEIQEASAETISLNDLKDLLYSSSNLSMEDKEFLYNEDLFKLVIRISSNGRNYSLREKFKDINIWYFNENDDERSKKISGYYNPLEPSSMYLRDDVINDTNKYNDVLSHEFIHLLQTNNEYKYINEGCAEILSSEYYGQVNNSYNEIVKRVKILIEIIGPKPIIECNFNNDTTIFESYIGRYLNEEDKEKLLNLLKAEDTDLCEALEVKELNRKIDVLLSKMFFNKTGQNIEEDLMMNILSNATIDDRYYFNSDEDSYREEYILYHDREDIDIIPLEEVINSNNVVKYVWHKNYIFVKDNKRVQGYTLVETTDFNEIEGAPNEFVVIEFRDGTKGEIRFNYDRNNWSDVYHYRVIPITEPSITDKFPGQVSEINYNNSKTM